MMEKMSLKKYLKCMPLIPVLRRQRQVDLCEFEANLVYSTSSMTVRATQRNPVSKNRSKTI